MGAARITPRIGELCFGGDWACAHGDLGGLADIVEQLAVRVHEPLHCRLRELQDLCRRDPVRATAAWFELKEQVLEDAAPR